MTPLGGREGGRDSRVEPGKALALLANLQWAYLQPLAEMSEVNVLRSSGGEGVMDEYCQQQLVKILYH